MYLYRILSNISEDNCRKVANFLLGLDMFGQCGYNSLRNNEFLSMWSPAGKLLRGDEEREQNGKEPLPPNVKDSITSIIRASIYCNGYTRMKETKTLLTLLRLRKLDASWSPIIVKEFSWMPLFEFLGTRRQMQSALQEVRWSCTVRG